MPSWVVIIRAFLSKDSIFSCCCDKFIVDFIEFNDCFFHGCCRCVSRTKALTFSYLASYPCSNCPSHSWRGPVTPCNPMVWYWSRNPLVHLIHAALWPMIINLDLEIVRIKKQYTKVIMAYNISFKDKVIKIYGLGSLPAVISAMRIGWSRAWRAFISAEMILVLSVGKVASDGLYSKRGSTAIFQVCMQVSWPLSFAAWP